MAPSWRAATAQLLREWGAQPRAFDSWGKGLADLAGQVPWRPGTQPRLAPFLNIGEGILFRELIAQGLASGPARVERLVDLGCGSSLPTLAAILGLPEDRRPAQVRAVDIDEAAVAASRHNVAAAGLEFLYRLDRVDMLSVLPGLATASGPADLIVGNPPYVPAPEGSGPGFLTPVDGGTDGLRFLRPLLQAPLRAGTRLAVVASSLSSPPLLAQLIRDAFRVRHCEAHVVPFGPYLKSEPIRAHVMALHEQEAVDCLRLPDGQNGFMTFTLLLEKV